MLGTLGLINPTHTAGEQTESQLKPHGGRRFAPRLMVRGPWCAQSRSLGHKYPLRGWVGVILRLNTAGRPDWAKKLSSRGQICLQCGSLIAGGGRRAVCPRPYRTLSIRKKKRIRNEIQSKKREKERERGLKTRFWVAARWKEERCKKRRFVGPK